MSDLLPRLNINSYKPDQASLNRAVWGQDERPESPNLDQVKAQQKDMDAMLDKQKAQTAKNKKIQDELARGMRKLRGED